MLMRSDQTIYLSRLLIVAQIVFNTGCGEFYDRSATIEQSKTILRELRNIEVIPEVNEPLPDRYLRKPVIVPGDGRTLLFYYTRHHPPDKLAALISDRLRRGVSENAAANQLIVECNSPEDANSTLAFLREVDVPPIQVKVDCIISELFADLTMDYETSADIANLFGEQILLQSLLPGASLRAPGRAEIGLKAGVSRDKFNTLIDILESRGYAKVLMRPTVEIVNGRKARIQIKERVPTPEKILSGNTVIDTVQYVDVLDYLEVVPQVYADGTIGLRTSAGIASKSPDGVEQVPIITEREIANEENRLRKGQSLVIGGIIKTERMSVVRGVPLLQDLPLLGALFSGKDFEDRAKEILFVLTPSISTNGTTHSSMVERIRTRHMNGG